MGEFLRCAVTEGAHLALDLPAAGDVALFEDVALQWVSPASKGCAGMDGAASDDTHGMQKGQSVEILADSSDGLVDEAPDCAVSQHQAVEFL